VSGDIYAALDLARVSGICWGELNGKPSFDTWTLGSKADARGDIGLQMMRRMVEFITTVRPVKFFIETPMEARVLVAIGSSLNTTIQLQGLVFLAETVAHSRGVPTQLLTRQDALRHFTGQKSFPKSLGKDAAKKACLVRCTQLRWMVAGYDEADAGALWHFGCAREDPRGYALAGVNEAVKVSRGKLL
jgi:hypothetical protein